MNKSPKVQLSLISQEIANAQNALNEAKARLRELEESLSTVLPSSRDLPGIIGKFDGGHLVTDDNQKFLVPENYAGKSKLVFGDTLKMIEGAEESSAIFKQIERVPRTVLTGVLAKKDGKLVAITSDGTHQLLPAAVSFHKGQEGDEVKVIVPEDRRNCVFAAVDEVPSRSQTPEIPPRVETAPKLPVSSAPPPKKERISSITVEPEPKIEVAPEVPKVETKVPPPPLEKPKVPKVPPAPTVVSVAPAPSTVSSILSDDDLR